MTFVNANFPAACSKLAFVNTVQFVRGVSRFVEVNT